MRRKKRTFELNVDKTIDFLDNELKNFQEIAYYLTPCSGEIPELEGIDIYGESIPYNGVVGGDHIIYLDFNKRYDLDHRINEAQRAGLPHVVEKLHFNKQRAGILLADAAGHNITDALLAAMLHQAFLTGVQYELREKGEVTAELFEILNTRFFNSASITKFITLIYGEISTNGNFNFISAGHPSPFVFSYKYDKLINICGDRVIHFPPIGTLPSKEDVDSRRNFSRLGYKKKYTINEISLMGEGDILILCTDGLSEHHNESMHDLYVPRHLEQILKQIKEAPAKEIWNKIKEDLLNFAPAEDDISYVVIKKASKPNVI